MLLPLANGMGILGGVALWRLWIQYREACRLKRCRCLRANDGMLCASAASCGVRVAVPTVIVVRR